MRSTHHQPLALSHFKKETIVGHYEDLMQIRIFTLITGLKSAPFLLKLSEFIIALIENPDKAETMIEKTQQNILKLDLVKEILEEMGISYQKDGDDWIRENPYAFRANIGDSSFLKPSSNPEQSHKVREQILNRCEAAMEMAKKT